MTTGRNSGWTVEEAVALLMGLEPGEVDESAQSAEFRNVQRLATRSREMHQLEDRWPPARFLLWTRDHSIEYPEELDRAVKQFGQEVRDWQTEYANLKAQYDRLLAENERLKERNEYLEPRHWDPETETTPGELDLALQAWRHVSQNRDPSQRVKQQLISWLKEYGGEDLSGEARERIARVANWEKGGGKPRKQS